MAFSQEKCKAIHLFSVCQHLNISLLPPLYLFHLLFHLTSNGPVGSALCVYTFDGLGETLSGNFLVQSAASVWTEAENEPPLTVSSHLNIRAYNLTMLRPFFFFHGSV